MTATAAGDDDAALIDRFLDMMAAQHGAARNTLAAYRRDLDQASEALPGGLAAADAAALGGLGATWAALAPASVARKASASRTRTCATVATCDRLRGRGSPARGRWRR